MVTYVSGVSDPNNLAATIRAERKKKERSQEMDRRAEELQKKGYSVYRDEKGNVYASNSQEAARAAANAENQKRQAAEQQARDAIVQQALKEPGSDYQKKQFERIRVVSGTPSSQPEVSGIALAEQPRAPVRINPQAAARPSGFLTAATPGEEASRQSGGVKRFTSGFKQFYARVSGGDDVTPVDVSGVPQGAVERAGYGAGIISLNAGRVVPAASRLASTRVVQPVARVLEKTPVIGQYFARNPFLTQAGITIAGSTGITAAGREAGSLSGDERSRSLTSRDFYSLYQQKIDEKLAQEGTLPQKISRGITIAAVPLSVRQEAEQEVRKLAAQRGYTREEQELVVKQVGRTASGAAVGQVGGQLFANVASESIGQQQVLERFNTLRGFTADRAKIGRRTFSTLFSPIGRAGAVEGASIVGVEQVATQAQRPYLPYTVPDEKDKYQFYDPKRYTNIRLGLIGEQATGAGIGYGVAGTVGGGIAALEAKKSPLAKPALIGAYLSDPFEYLGDVGEKVVRKQAARAARITVPEPSIVLQPRTQARTQSDPFSFGLSYEPTTSSVAAAKRARVNSRAFTNILGYNPTVPATSIATTTRITGRTPVPINQNIPVFPTQPDITYQYNTRISENINVPTQIPVPINLPISTTVPLLRIPPPLYPGTGDFGGLTGLGRKASRGVFINELAFGEALFRKLGAQGIARVPEPRSARSTGRPRLKLTKAEKKAIRRQQQIERKTQRLFQVLG